MDDPFSGLEPGRFASPDRAREITENGLKGKRNWRISALLIDIWSKYHMKTPAGGAGVVIFAGFCR